MMTEKYQNDTREHRNAIQEFLYADPAWGFQNAYLFVVASIRQKFYTLNEVMGDWQRYLAKVGEIGQSTGTVELPTSAWGMKADALEAVATGMDSWCAEQGAFLIAEDDTATVLDHLVTLPGLGLVKAGFLAQLYGFKVGCIDSHNASIFQVRVEDYNIRVTMKAETRQRKIREYIDLCYAIGGSDFLWDNWCAYLSGIYVSVGTPTDVSAKHVELICQ